MMDKETYKRELVRMWDSLRTENKGEYSCYGVDCDFCPLGRRCDRIFSFEMIEAVEKWAREHPQKHKVSQLEYDILEQYANCGFACCFLEYDLLMSLLKKGYFKGADEKMNIDYYFNHCEVMDDDIDKRQEQ